MRHGSLSLCVELETYFVRRYVSGGVKYSGGVVVFLFGH